MQDCVLFYILVVKTALTKMEFVMRKMTPN
jgi:hypothetical protein